MNEELINLQLKKILLMYSQPGLASEISSKFVKESHAECGKGFVYVDVTDFINKNYSAEQNLANYWYNADEYGLIQAPLAQEKVKTLLEDYNSSTEYILVLTAKSNQDFKYRYVIDKVPLLETKPLPTNLSTQQIRKRLKRMKQGGKKSVNIDRNHPDFMGNNLEKWLKEIEDFNQREKGIFFVVEERTV